MSISLWHFGALLSLINELSFRWQTHTHMGARLQIHTHPSAIVHKATFWSPFVIFIPEFQNSYVNNNTEGFLLMQRTSPSSLYRVTWLYINQKKCLTAGAISEIDILAILNKVDFTIGMHGYLSVALHSWIPLSVCSECTRALQIRPWQMVSL